MITVAVQPEREPMAAEFFELFKTPWQFFRSSRPCSVLLTDGSIPVEAPARLVLVFSPLPLPGDRLVATRAVSTEPGKPVRLPDGSHLAVYTATRFFGGDAGLMMDEQTGATLAYAEERNGRTTVRVGYDLFDETAYLLDRGQPSKYAGLPALDRHIAFLRRCILNAGIPLIEIPPCRAGHPYMVSLTHDVDFAGIRCHGIDRTVLGFARRALFDSFRRALTRRITWCQAGRNLAAVLSLPLVQLGLRRDFWNQFEAYRQLEQPHHSTFFLIPFANRPGTHVDHPHPERRAARYTLEQIRNDVDSLRHAGWEFDLHGIDAWHDAGNADLERQRLGTFLDDTVEGIRMHWLCRNERTDQILDQTGFSYDSSCGYNDTIGFRAGTSQVFRPPTARRMLELPLHIQDCALFYPDFLDLDDATAWTRCTELLQHQRDHGGVATVLWHMRSLAPERLWDGFYKRLLDQFNQDNAWVGTASQIVAWFDQRRRTRLSCRTAPNGELVAMLGDGKPHHHAKVVLRIHRAERLPPSVPHAYVDIPWRGEPEIRTGLFMDLDLAREAPVEMELE